MGLFYDIVFYFCKINVIGPEISFLGPVKMLAAFDKWEAGLATNYCKFPLDAEFEARNDCWTKGEADGLSFRGSSFSFYEVLSMLEASGLIKEIYFLSQYF